MLDYLPPNHLLVFFNFCIWRFDGTALAQSLLSRYQSSASRKNECKGEDGQGGNPTRLINELLGIASCYFFYLYWQCFLDDKLYERRKTRQKVIEGQRRKLEMGVEEKCQTDFYSSQSGNVRFFLSVCLTPYSPKNRERHAKQASPVHPKGIDDSVVGRPAAVDSCISSSPTSSGQARPVRETKDLRGTKPSTNFSSSIPFPTFFYPSLSATLQPHIPPIYMAT